MPAGSIAQHVQLRSLTVPERALTVNPTADRGQERILWKFIGFNPIGIARVEKGLRTETEKWFQWIPGLDREVQAFELPSLIWHKMRLYVALEPRFALCRDPFGQKVRVRQGQTLKGPDMGVERMLPVDEGEGVLNGGRQIYSHTYHSQSSEIRRPSSSMAPALSSLTV